jgi:hypothetical protein
MGPLYFVFRWKKVQMHWPETQRVLQLLDQNRRRACERRIRMSVEGREQQIRGPLQLPLQLDARLDPYVAAFITDQGVGEESFDPIRREFFEVDVIRSKRQAQGCSRAKEKNNNLRRGDPNQHAPRQSGRPRHASPCFFVGMR